MNSDLTTTTIALNPRELASIVEALRARQDEISRDRDHASNPGAFDELEGPAINALVAKIQLGAPEPVRVVLQTDGGVLQGAFADGPFQLLVLDSDTEGGDEDAIIPVEGEQVYVTRFGTEVPGDAGSVDPRRVEAVFSTVGNGTEESDGRPRYVVCEDWGHIFPGDELTNTRWVIDRIGGSLVKAQAQILDADRDQWVDLTGDQARDLKLSLDQNFGGGDYADANLAHFGVDLVDELPEWVDVQRDAIGRQQLPPPIDEVNVSGDGPDDDALLQSCPTVYSLLVAVQRAVEHVTDRTVRQELLDRLEPFKSGVAAAFYSRSDMVEQSPDDVEVSDADVDAALEQLVRDFPHPWETFSGSFSDEVHRRARESQAIDFRDEPELRPRPEMVTQLSGAFLRGLLDEVGVDRLRQVALANEVETMPGVCHTHDVCDANMVMAKAYTDVMGVEVDLRSHSQAAMWNAAWNEAKSSMSQFLQLQQQADVGIRRERGQVG